MVLNANQKRFAELYVGEANGNAGVAAQLAGYKAGGNRYATVGYRLRHHPLIAAYICELESQDPAVASRRERLKFYSEVMRSPAEATKDRLKAAETLGKIFGDHTFFDAAASGRAASEALVILEESLDSSTYQRVLEALRGGEE